jgi:hypothetical protein
MDFFAGLITGIMLGAIIVAIVWSESQQLKNK